MIWRFTFIPINVQCLFEGHNIAHGAIDSMPDDRYNLMWASSYFYRHLNIYICIFLQVCTVSETKSALTTGDVF